MLPLSLLVTDALMPSQQTHGENGCYSRSYRQLSCTSLNGCNCQVAQPWWLSEMKGDASPRSVCSRRCKAFTFFPHGCTAAGVPFKCLPRELQGLPRPSQRVTVLSSCRPALACEVRRAVMDGQRVCVTGCTAAASARQMTLLPTMAAAPYFTPLTTSALTVVSSLGLGVCSQECHFSLLKEGFYLAHNSKSPSLSGFWHCVLEVISPAHRDGIKSASLLASCNEYLYSEPSMGSLLPKAVLNHRVQAGILQILCWIFRSPHPSSKSMLPSQSQKLPPLKEPSVLSNSSWRWLTGTSQTCPRCVLCALF